MGLRQSKTTNPSINLSRAHLHKLRDFLKRHSEKHLGRSVSVSSPDFGTIYFEFDSVEGTYSAIFVAIHRVTPTSRFRSRLTISILPPEG